MAAPLSIRRQEIFAALEPGFVEHLYVISFVRRQLPAQPFFKSPQNFSLRRVWFHKLNESGGIIRGAVTTFWIESHKNQLASFDRLPFFIIRTLVLAFSFVLALYFCFSLFLFLQDFSFKLVEQPYVVD